MEHFPKEKNMSDVAKKVRSCWGLGGGSSDLQTEPSLSLAACNPSHEEKKNSEGRGWSEGEEEGRFSSYVETIACVQDSNDKSNQRTKTRKWWRKDVPPG